ncbi:MAG: helix-turn-helix transcriptional regulator [Hahellaceae bacterium]|nr:helix-turn-helix transcriptional regulator [Hahellaceae bacterium]
MKWDDIQELPCSIARTLSVIGDRWTLMIVRECFLGTRRFEQFQKRLGVTRHRLSERLNKLVEHGILRKQLYQESPARYEYRLTRKGVELYPILMAMVQWGDTWMDDGAGPPLVYQHTSCGQLMHMELHCSACGEKVSPHEVVPQPGPGLKSWQATQAKKPKIQ